MTIRYLKDISSLLALVSAERHLQAEREILKYCFAFHHINYTRYLSYQQVYLTSLEANNSPAISHLKEESFGGSLSGQPFSAMHGDLVIEIFNGQTKRQAGPYASGFSTNIDTVNKWVNTANIHAQIRAVFSEKLQLTTSSQHKECTPRLHYDHVKALKQQLRQYSIDPFASCHTRDITIGVELAKNLIKV